MKLHGNTLVESHRLSRLGVEPCSEKNQPSQTKRDKNELVGLCDCSLPEIYIQH